MRHRAIHCKMWRDARFRKLPAGGKLTFTYLLTGPETTNIPGVVPVGLAALADGLGEGFETVSAWLAEVSKAGLASVDLLAPLIFLPNRIKYDQPANPNVVKGWAKTWGDLPDSPLLPLIYETLRKHIATRPKPFGQAFASIHKPFSNTDPDPDPDPETESQISRSVGSANASRASEPAADQPTNQPIWWVLLTKHWNSKPELQRDSWPDRWSALWTQREIEMEKAGLDPYEVAETFAANAAAVKFIVEQQRALKWCIERRERFFAIVDGQWSNREAKATGTTEANPLANVETWE
jgi:hypothetical protein